MDSRYCTECGRLNRRKPDPAGLPTVLDKAIAGVAAVVIGLITGGIALALAFGLVIYAIESQDGGEVALASDPTLLYRAWWHIIKEALPPAAIIGGHIAAGWIVWHSIHSTWRGVLRWLKPWGFTEELDDDEIPIRAWPRDSGGTV